MKKNAIVNWEPGMTLLALRDGSKLVMPPHVADQLHAWIRDDDGSEIWSSPPLQMDDGTWRVFHIDRDELPPEAKWL